MTGWNDFIWQQIYGNGAGAQTATAPTTQFGETPQVPHYLDVLQQAASANVPLADISLSGIDAVAHLSGE